MKNLGLILAVFVFMAGLGFSWGPCENPWVIDESGDYEMDADLSELNCYDGEICEEGDPCDCIVINNNDISLDCNDHYIDRSGNAGIYTIDIMDGLTIKNCRINGEYGYGIYTEDTMGGEIYNNHVYGSEEGIGSGVYIKGCIDILVHDNIIEDCTAPMSGIDVEGSHEIWIFDNTVRNNGAGIYIYQPEEEPEEGNHLIFGNTITGNSNVGIKIDFDGGCEIYDNTITDNEIEGIDIYSSFNNIIHDNKISGSQVLIYVDDNEDTCADNNIFYDNDLRDLVEGGDGPYYYVDDDACGDNYLSAYYDGEIWLGCTEAYGEEGPYCHGNYYDHIDGCSLTNLYGDDIYYDSGDDYPIPSECIGDYFFIEGGDTTYSDYGPRTKGLITTSRGGSGNNKEEEPEPELNAESVIINNKTTQTDELGRVIGCYGEPGITIDLGSDFSEYKIFAKYHDIIVNRCTTDSKGRCNLVLGWPGEFVVKVKGDGYVKTIARKACEGEVSEAEQSLSEIGGEQPGGQPGEQPGQPIEQLPAPARPTSGVVGDTGELSISQRLALGLL